MTEKEFREKLANREKKITQELFLERFNNGKQIYSELSNEEKLQILTYLINTITSSSKEHIQTLIYDTLNLDGDAYFAMKEAGLIDIYNSFK
jgi:hypothetical protein